MKSWGNLGRATGINQLRREIMAKLTDEEFAVAEVHYDEQIERLAARDFDYDFIAEYDCVIEDMTPGESAAIIDKYYDF